MFESCNSPLVLKPQHSSDSCASALIEGFEKLQCPELQHLVQSELSLGPNHEAAIPEQHLLIDESRPPNIKSDLGDQSFERNTEQDPQDTHDQFIDDQPVLIENFLKPTHPSFERPREFKTVGNKISSTVGSQSIDKSELYAPTQYHIEVPFIEVIKQIKMQKTLFLAELPTLVVSNQGLFFIPSATVESRVQTDAAHQASV